MKHFLPSPPSPISPDSLPGDAASEGGRYVRVRLANVPLQSWRATMAWLSSNPGHYISEPESNCAIFIGRHQIYQMDLCTGYATAIEMARWKPSSTSMV